MTTTENHGKMYMKNELLPPKKNQEANSTHRMSRLDLQRAITDAKRFIESRLESDLRLVKHVAPMAFLCGTGINDELDGSESKSAVRFTVLNQDIPRGIKVEQLHREDEKVSLPSKSSMYEMQCEVCQSLAKWKRIMLGRLNCKVNEGIYCDSTSIRKGYKGDVTHSIIADQWDFEIRIANEQRTVDQLQAFVRVLWKVIIDAEDFILEKYSAILLDGHPTAAWRLPRDITFVTSEELHAMFPSMGVHDRENAAVDKFGAIFIIGMGWPMKDGSAPEEVRSPGYDDWNLNGDIIVRHPLTEYRHELSSMGIRVDKDSLLAQLKHRGAEKDRDLEFMKSVIDDKLPFSFGGGLGISRILMLILRTGHIGEVQAGVWHDAHYDQASQAGIDLIPDRIVTLSQ